MITQHFADLVQEPTKEEDIRKFHLELIHGLHAENIALKAKNDELSGKALNAVFKNKILSDALEAVKSKTSGMIEKLVASKSIGDFFNATAEEYTNSLYASAGGRCITSEEPTGTSEGTDWIEFKDAEPFIDNHIEILAALVDHGLVDSLKKSLAGDVQEAVTLSATLAMITVIVTDHYKNR